MSKLTPWLNAALYALALLTPWMSGCASAETTDSVAVTAVNYTGQEMNAVLFMDPNNPDKVAGGSGADPYGGSGAMCCYSLPRQWHPGIKVSVRYDWWSGSSADRRYQTITAELPPYPTKEPGVLWALFYEDGSVQVLASAVDPGHALWPGKIKHWPVPSREYKLKLWQMDYDELADLVPAYEHEIQGLSESELKEEWDHDLKYWKEKTVGFSGPTDPKFAEAVRKDARESLASIKERLAALEGRKP